MRPCPPPHPNPSKPKLVLPAGATDAHCHVFGPADVFPYSEKRAYTPQDAPKDMLAALHKHLGISRTVIVQASCHGTDNRAMVDALQDDPINRRGVASVEMDCDATELSRLNDAGVRGARFNFMSRISPMPDVSEIAPLIKRMADIGWHIVVHFDPDALPELSDWLKGLPVPVVVDHMARLAGSDAGGEYHKMLLELMEKEHAWVKISGAERGTDAGVPYDDITPIAQSLVAAAPDRILWGTDWPHPVMSKPMPDDGFLVDYLATMVPDEALRNRILVDNPARLYGF